MINRKISLKKCKIERKSAFGKKVPFYYNYNYPDYPDPQT